MAWYDKWAIMAIAAAIGVAGYNCIPWCKMDITVWAYWVGAIGTIGALGGTIWLATSERRIRRRQEFALAQVTAASFAEQIRVTSHKLGYAIATLKNFAENPAKANFADLHRVNEITEIWTPADTIPLVVLPKGVAMELSAICTQFKTTQHNLVIAAREMEITGVVRQDFIRTQIREYERLREKLDLALKICLYACYWGQRSGE
jgi:hypothetical protein